MWPQSQSSHPTDLTVGDQYLAPLPGARLRNPTDPTLFHFSGACKQVGLSTVEMIAKRRRTNDGSLNWGFYAALEANRADVARLFLRLGVPIDLRAISVTKSQECFQVFIDHGWGVNDPLEYGDPDFLYAPTFGLLYPLATSIGLT